MKTIVVAQSAGAFAENKDVARDIRIREIIPAIDGGEEVVLDFHGVDAATQSFIHALLSDLLRRYGSAILDRIEFRSCAVKVRKVIEIVVEYMQEGLR